MKDQKHSFGEKLKEVIVEILIIVFAVTLSIWLHSWSEHKHEQKEVTEFLEDLKVDLKSDIKDLEKQNSYLNITSKKCNLFKSLTKSRIDSILQLKAENKIYLNLNPISKIRNTGNYEGFLSSGKIGLIEKRHLKNKILNYYQKIVPEKDEWQIYYNSLVFEMAREDINFTTYETFLKSVYASKKVKRIFGNCELQAEQMVRINNTVIKNAKQILTEIDKETKI